MIDTVKTAVAFILAHCPAIPRQSREKHQNIWDKTRGKRPTGNWEVVRGEREDWRAWVKITTWRGGEPRERRLVQYQGSEVLSRYLLFPLPINLSAPQQHINSFTK